MVPLIDEVILDNKELGYWLARVCPRTEKKGQETLPSRVVMEHMLRHSKGFYDNLLVLFTSLIKVIHISTNLFKCSTPE